MPSNSSDPQTTSRTEQIDAATAEQYRGTFALDYEELSQGDVLPRGWEGLYFPFTSPIDGLRPDGSPRDDGFADIRLPRRMYAGEDTHFYRPLRIGATVEQRTRLGEVIEKVGKNGQLVFADIHRQYLIDGEVAVESTWHDVFLPADAHAPAARPKVAKTDPSWWHVTVAPDSRHLFRFSAITFNSHRVHYDRAWAQESEGLEDLLVHGPLTRMLLLDAMVNHHPAHEWTAYIFKAIAPLFVGQTITLAGRERGSAVEAVAINHHGNIAAMGQLTG